MDQIEKQFITSCQSNLAQEGKEKIKIDVKNKKIINIEPHYLNFFAISNFDLKTSS